MQWSKSEPFSIRKEKFESFEKKKAKAADWCTRKTLSQLLSCLLEQRNASKNTKNFTINSKFVKVWYLSRRATVSISKKFQAKTALPLVVYFDLEPIIGPVSSVQQNPQTFRNSCLGQKHSERLLLCSHFTWKSKFGVLSSVQRGRLHASFCEASGDTSKRYLPEKAKPGVLHGRRWTCKRACNSLLDMWNYFFCGQQKSLGSLPFFKSVSWLKVQATAQNTELPSHNCTQLVRIWLAPCCIESSSLQP